MKIDNKELASDGLSQLWILSKKCEDYWREVASFEWDDCLSFFKVLAEYPEQLDSYFGKLPDETQNKLRNYVLQLSKKNRGYTPGFFETCLWASLIEIRSQALRKEWIELTLNLDQTARQLIGAATEIPRNELELFLLNSRRWKTLSKHVHPAFSESDEAHSSVIRKVA